MKIKELLIVSVPILFLILAGKIYYDTNSIEVRHFQVKDSPLGEVLAGLKVAHLSDLHMKSIGIRENKIIEILGEEKPDLIFLTGDFISFRGSYNPVMSFFTQLKAPFGVYGALGNTEYSNEKGSCILCHLENSRTLKKESNPTFLRNSHISLNLNERLINLIGLDDPVKRKDDFKAAIHGLDPKIPGILLAHSPEILEKADQTGIDFVLCGHNHGGQVFFTKYLHKIIPLDPGLEFPGGFFQQGKTLMYVNRGVGTSFLPFRLGVKPEITFFTFLSQPDQSRGSFKITNSPTSSAFAGFSFSNFFDIFEFYPISSVASRLGDFFRNNSIWSMRSATGKEAASSDSSGRHGSTAAPQHRSTSSSLNASRLATYDILFDFESESDLMRLNWQCHKWFERSNEHASSGKYSLRVILPPEQYPGIDFQEFSNDWSKGEILNMEVFNPSEEQFTFHIRIDDHKSGWDYANRFDRDFNLQPGMNAISIQTKSMQTNINPRPLDLKKIDRLMVFIPNNSKKREIYIDNIRIE